METATALVEYDADRSGHSSEDEYQDQVQWKSSAKTTSRVSMVKKYVCSYPECTFKRNGKKHNIERHVWLQHVRKNLSLTIPYSAQNHRNLVKQWILQIDLERKTLTTGSKQRMLWRSISSTDDQGTDSGFSVCSPDTVVNGKGRKGGKTTPVVKSKREKKRSVSSCHNCDELATPVSFMSVDTHERYGQTPVETTTRFSFSEASTACGLENHNQAPKVYAKENSGYHQNQRDNSYQNDSVASDTKWEYEKQRVGGYHYEEPCGYFAQENEPSQVHTHACDCNLSDCTGFVSCTDIENCSRSNVCDQFAKPIINRAPINSNSSHTGVWRPFVAV
eukprot:CFRG6483T1